MTIIESPLDKEALREAVHQAIRETADETDCKDTPKDVYMDAYINVEDRGYIDEIIRGDDDQKQNVILVSVSALLLIVAPISGCIMWFTSVPLWINIAILALTGIVGGIFSRLSEPRDFSENIGVDIVCSIIACVLNALFYLLVTAILMAVIEGFLWICGLIF